MNISKRKIIYSGIVIVIIIISFFSVWLLLQKPSHNRDWENGQDQLPFMTMENNMITVKNFRDFDWRVDGSVENVYRTETFDLDKIEGMDVFISHFDEFEGLAHFFISFRFSDQRNLVVSVETRREIGEKFSPLGGLMRQFELIYVVGSERDIVGSRTDIRGERVYIYPTVIKSEKAKKLFLLLMSDINTVHGKPVFYNTLFNNCTNAITRRIEDVSKVDFPLTYKTVLPGFMDEVLYDMQLIPCDRSFGEVKDAHVINNSVLNKNDPEYSQKLRVNK